MGMSFCGLDGFKTASGYRNAFCGFLTNHYPATTLEPTQDGHPALPGSPSPSISFPMSCS